MSEKREPKFRVGQRIEWQSQAAGVWRKKTGTIVAILRPNESIPAVLAGKGLDVFAKLKIGNRLVAPKINAMSKALITRYLVETTVPGKRRTFYAPDLARAEKAGKVVK